MENDPLACVPWIPKPVKVKFTVAAAAGRQQSKIKSPATTVQTETGDAQLERDLMG
jgi:hypothetical protein